MPAWSRVFGTSALPPDQASLIDYVRSLVTVADFAFEGERDSWLAADFQVGASEPLHMERFLATEAGIRGELNAWTAWLEACEEHPHSGALMEHIIQTAQLFLLRCPEPTGDPAAWDQVAESLCRYLARMTHGVYQRDGRGIFAADGTLLIEE